MACVDVDELLARAGLRLEESTDGLAIGNGSMSVRGDFAHMSARLKPANLKRELIVRAAKVKGAQNPPFAIDATAGLGEDSLLLAAAGFRVLLIERNPVVALLLRDAMERAAQDGRNHTLADAVSRMELVEGDSTAIIPQLSETPDVVVLDPMFPAKGKDAAAKKKLQLIQRLEAPCDDERELLETALASHPRKVVVKRPLKGPYFADRKPDYTLSGKAIRFDCYAIPRKDA